MADILLKRDSTLAATYVPNTFIDEYMTHADGEFVKIYLYLLRCMGNPDTVFSISDIADKFDHTEKDVTRALKYWEKMHLLRLEFNKQEELTGICLSGYGCNTSCTEEPGTSANAEAAAHTASADAPKKCAQKDTQAVLKKHRLPERTAYSRNQLALLSESESVQEILFVTERYLGHPLNNTEIQMILYWLDKLKFSPNLVEYLIEQCVAKNHMSIRYMDKIALSWAEAGIRTLTDAKQASQLHDGSVYAVQKAFGISNRTLAQAELKFVQKWSEELGFADEVIALACEKTILRIHQISFDYADSILQNWKQHNVRTVNDVRLLDAQYQEAKAKKASAGKAAMRTAKGTAATGFANFSQRTYNYEELERELLSQAR